MALKITYDQLRRELGRLLGFDRDPTNWTTNQTDDVADYILFGLREFYWPSIEGVPAHVWSFLCPTATISLAATTSDYDLPTNFIRLATAFTFSGDEHPPLSIVSEEHIRALRSRDGLDKYPSYAAIRPKSHSDDAYELLVYPTPDESATLEYRYEMMPSTTLSSGNPYHLGSAAHSQTFLTACLMCADQSLNKETAEAANGGLFAERFRSLLRTSISIDQQVFQNAGSFST